MKKGDLKINQVSCCVIFIASQNINLSVLHHIVIQLFFMLFYFQLSPHSVSYLSSDFFSLSSLYFYLVQIVFNFYFPFFYFNSSFIFIANCFSNLPVLFTQSAFIFLNSQSFTILSFPLLICISKSLCFSRLLSILNLLFPF